MRRTISNIAFATIAGLIITMPAYAIDFKTHIKSIDGSDIPISTTDQSPLTLGKVCEDALIANTLPGDQPNADEKTKRFMLVLKVHANNDPLTAEEVTMIKKVVGMAYGPLVVGRVAELLDPASISTK